MAHVAQFAGGNGRHPVERRRGSPGLKAAVRRPFRDTIRAVDSLEANDRELAEALGPAEKLAQALEMMSAGIRLKRSNLRLRFPDADDAQVERLLTAWLTEDG